MHCFKEWQIICDALRSGKQSILLRKGGIHEGKGGFSFGNISRFSLFPTRFHAQKSQVSEQGDFSPGKEWEVGDPITFDLVCDVVKTLELTSWEQVQALESYHIWTENCIKDRFYWEGKDMQSGKIHLALLRVHTASPPPSISYSARLGGCRSWVDLEELVFPPSLSPVIPDEPFQALQTSITHSLAL